MYWGTDNLKIQKSIIALQGDYVYLLENYNIFLKINQSTIFVNFILNFIQILENKTHHSGPCVPQLMMI